MKPGTTIKKRNTTHRTPRMNVYISKKSSKETMIKIKMKEAPKAGLNPYLTFSTPSEICGYLL